MLSLLKRFWRIFKRSRKAPADPPAHSHQWLWQYEVGEPPTANMYRCDCGKWAIKHFRESEFKIIDQNIVN